MTQNVDWNFFNSSLFKTIPLADPKTALLSISFEDAMIAYMNDSLEGRVNEKRCTMKSGRGGAWAKARKFIEMKKKKDDSAPIPNNTAGGRLVSPASISNRKV